MFEFNKDTFEIRMHQGDTGSFWVSATRSSGEDFGENDRALFTVTDPTSGENVIEREYALDDDDNLGNGVIHVELHNGDTDHLAAGIYDTEIRYVINPYRSGGKITDGDIVRTPAILKSTLTLMSVNREV